MSKAARGKAAGKSLFGLALALGLAGLLLSVAACDAAYQDLTAGASTSVAMEPATTSD